MPQPYYPPGTHLGPPTLECEEVLVWFGDRGFPSPSTGELVVDDGELVFAPQCEWGNGVHPPASAIVAWLPLVPLEDSPGLGDLPKYPAGTILGQPDQECLIVMAWRANWDWPTIGSILPKVMGSGFFFSPHGTEHLLLEDIIAWLPLKK